MCNRKAPGGHIHTESEAAKIISVVDEGNYTLSILCNNPISRLIHDSAFDKPIAGVGVIPADL